MLSWRKTLFLTTRPLDLVTIFTEYMEELASTGRGEEVAAMRLAPAAILDLMRIAASVNHSQLQPPTTPPAKTTPTRWLSRSQKKKEYVATNTGASQPPHKRARMDNRDASDRSYGHQPKPRNDAGEKAVRQEGGHQPKPRNNAGEKAVVQQGGHQPKPRNDAGEKAVRQEGGHQPKPRNDAGEKAVVQEGAGQKPRGGKGDHQVNRANTGSNAQYSVKNDGRGSHTSNGNVRASRVEEYKILLSQDVPSNVVGGRLAVRPHQAAPAAGLSSDVVPRGRYLVRLHCLAQCDDDERPRGRRLPWPGLC